MLLTVIDVYPDNFGLRVLLVEDPQGQQWEAGVAPLHVRPLHDKLLAYVDESIEECLKRYGGRWVRKAIPRAQRPQEVFQWVQRKWELLDTVGRKHGEITAWNDEAGTEYYSGLLCEPDGTKGTSSICSVPSLEVAMQQVVAAAGRRLQAHSTSGDASGQAYLGATPPSASDREARHEQEHPRNQPQQEV